LIVHLGGTAAKEGRDQRRAVKAKSRRVSHGRGVAVLMSLFLPVGPQSASARIYGPAPEAIPEQQHERKCVSIQ
jgi:hypothetical protein